MDTRASKSVATEKRMVLALWLIGVLGKARMRPVCSLISWIAADGRRPSDRCQRIIPPQSGESTSFYKSQ
ncbi:hypothetical protein EXIGLDRAFT_718376 [Exidia glandulosa HHB12029]|uniref:Secreted protein n=1 Tax=Exidia glandulosa HHB12029 TaxID=1314781 RepID=A0A165HSH3_EXIGL|nr:hypothetical protein EXIGLDRAFT_718376 [Exidia glandulosa HHB12029]